MKSEVTNLGLLPPANLTSDHLMKTRLTGLIPSLLLSLITTPIMYAADTVAVTVDNFARAESDLYFGGILKDSGGAIGKFNHRREPA